MDGIVAVASDVQDAFDRLIHPRHLGRWLPEVRQVGPEPGVVGVPFAVLLGSGARCRPARGELVTFEPPRHAAWRFFTPDTVNVVRLTCARDGAATRVRIHQEEGPSPRLQIDLDRLYALLSPSLPGMEMP